MTIAATITTKQYTGIGVGAQFSFPNKVFSASDLVITIYDTSGNVYPFVNFANAILGWTYSVQNVDVDTGCIVVLSNVLTSGWVLDIRSLIPELQSTSVKNQGQFLPELHEEAFDRATRMIQDLLRLTYTFGIHGPDTEFTPWPALPTASLRKGYALMFDGTTGLPALGFLSAQNVTIGLLAPLLGLSATAAEIAAAAALSIPITTLIANFAYPPLHAWRYGAVPDGVTNNTTALTYWITVLNQPGYLSGQSEKTGYLPGGAYLVTGALPAITISKVRIRGDGSDVSRILVGGSANYTALQIGNNVPTSTTLLNMQVDGIGLVKLSGIGTGVTTLMKVIQTQYSHYRDIYLFDNTNIVGDVNLEYRGHENNCFENLVTQGVQPIILGNPSGTAGDGCDHTEWRGLEMQSSNDTMALITVIGAGTVISNMKFTGTQVWLGGIRGFYWNDVGAGTGSGVGGDLVFENIRREQTSASSSGDSIYIRVGTTDFVTNLSVRDCTFGLPGTLSGGIHTDGVRWQTFENINNSVGGVGITSTARDTTYQLTTINVNVDPPATTLTSFEKVFGSNDLILGATNNPTTCVYQYTDVNNQTTRGARIYEGRKWIGKRPAVATAGNFIVPSSASSVGILTIAANAGAGSAEGGIFILQGSATTMISGTANTQAAIGAGKLSVTWNGGTTSYLVTNNLGNTRDILVDVSWM